MDCTEVESHNFEWMPVVCLRFSWAHAQIACGKAIIMFKNHLTGFKFLQVYSAYWGVESVKSTKCLTDCSKPIEIAGVKPPAVCVIVSATLFSFMISETIEFVNRNSIQFVN